MLLGAEKHDIDDEFAHVSPLHRRALWNHIEELKNEQEQLASNRMLAAVDFSNYNGSQAGLHVFPPHLPPRMTSHLSFTATGNRVFGIATKFMYTYIIYIPLIRYTD